MLFLQNAGAKVLIFCEIAKTFSYFCTPIQCIFYETTKIQHHCSLDSHRFGYYCCDFHVLSITSKRNPQQPQISSHCHCRNRCRVENRTPCKEKRKRKRKRPTEKPKAFCWHRLHGRRRAAARLSPPASSYFYHPTTAPRTCPRHCRTHPPRAGHEA